MADWTHIHQLAFHHIFVLMVVISETPLDGLVRHWAW